MAMGAPAWPLGTHHTAMMSLSIPGHQDPITWPWGLCGALETPSHGHGQPQPWGPCAHGHGDSCMAMGTPGIPRLQDPITRPRGPHGDPIHSQPPRRHHMAQGTSWGPYHVVLRTLFTHLWEPHPSLSLGTLSTWPWAPHPPPAPETPSNPHPPEAAVPSAPLMASP